METSTLPAEPSTTSHCCFLMEIKVSCAEMTYGLEHCKLPLISGFSVDQFPYRKLSRDDSLKQMIFLSLRKSQVTRACVRCQVQKTNIRRKTVSQTVSLPQHQRVRCSVVVTGNRYQDLTSHSHDL